MKKNYQNQRSTLRKALSILAVGVVIALTSLTCVVGEEIMIVGAGVTTERPYKDIESGEVITLDPDFKI